MSSAFHDVTANVSDVVREQKKTTFLHEGLNQPLIDYCVRQFKDLEDFLADLTKRPFDHDRFENVLLLSQEASDCWRSILKLGKNIPAPINAIDAFIHLAPIVTLRGTQTSVDYYKLLLAEVEERIRDGVSSIPEENYRVLWDNLPIWFCLNRLGKFFAEQKCAITTATYTNSWGEGIVEPFETDDIYEKLAAQYRDMSAPLSKNLSHQRTISFGEIFPRILTMLPRLPGIAKTLKKVLSYTDDDYISIGGVIEDSAVTFRDRMALIFEECC